MTSFDSTKHSDTFYDFVRQSVACERRVRDTYWPKAVAVVTPEMFIACASAERRERQTITKKIYLQPIHALWV